MITYRLKQLYHAIFPTIETSEKAWLDQLLSPRELSLFFRQSLTEQRHALDVAQDIQGQKTKVEACFGLDVYNALIKAALLHDCGKSVIPLRLWQRVFIVLTGYLSPYRQEHLFDPRSVFGRTLIIYRQHPVWGRRLAAKAGVHSDVLQLIENHHHPQTDQETVLCQADNRH